MKHTLFAIIMLGLIGCAGSDETEQASTPETPNEAPFAPSCRESNGLCRRQCYGVCDTIEDFAGACEGTCNGACCTDAE